MSGKKDDGGPAYPEPIAGCTDGSVYSADEVTGGNVGMSLRDKFAEAALIGLTSACDADGAWTGHYSDTADDAYRLADAMLEARKADNDNG